MCCWQIEESNHFFSIHAMAWTLQLAFCQVRPVENCTSTVGSCLKQVKGCMWASCWCVENFPARNSRNRPWNSSACSGGGGPNLAQVRFGCRVSALGVIFVFRGLQAGTFIDMSKENKEASTNGFIIRPRGAPIMKLPPTQIAPLLSRADNGVKDNQPSPVPAYTPFSMSSCTSH